MMGSGIVELLKAREGNAWYPGSPVSETEITATETAMRLSLPGDYRSVLRTYGAGALYGPESRVILISPDQLQQFNPDLERAPDLARMLIFADDEGDYFYFYDPTNGLARGAWSIFAVEMGLMERRHSFFVAQNLCQLFERALSDENIIELAWHQSRNP